MRRQVVRINRWSWGLITFWTLCLLGSYLWNDQQIASQLSERAHTELRANFFKDLSFRQWASRHGGVYVPVNEWQQPDPFLRGFPERDIITPSGKVLTLINPALMVRQFNELVSEEYSVTGHISGLRPINPVNAADEWEWLAFERFQQGEEEVTETTRIADSTFLRLIRPMYMAKPCLKCHAQQGFEEGELGGGISVALPLAPLERVHAERQQSLQGGHLLIWVVGFLGIVLGKRQIAFQISSREAAYRSLEESETRTRAIISHSMDGIITADCHGLIRGWNTQATTIFGWQEQEVLGQPLVGRIIPEQQLQAHFHGYPHALEKAEEGILCQHLEVTGLRRNDEEFPMELSVIATSTAGEINFSAFIRDLSEQREAQYKREQDYISQQLIASVLEISLKPVSFNRRLELILKEILSVPWLRLLGKGALFITEPDGHQLTMLVEQGVEEAVKAQCEKVEFGECFCGQAAKEKRIVYHSGHDELFTLPTPGLTSHGHYCLPILSGEQLLGVLNLYLEEGHAYDTYEITLLSTICHTIGGMIQRHQAEQQLRHNAYHDELTDLPNRTLLLERLQQRMTRLLEDPHVPFAVLFLDLDRFKVINDSLGHSVGDHLLVEVAKRLRDCVRSEDTIARLGGDEFVLLINQCDTVQEIPHLCERIYNILRDPYSIDTLELFAPCSIGVAYGSSRYQSPEEMLRDADTAMYRAKSHSANHTVIFDEQMHISAINRLTMENQLRQALEGDQLTVHYQPIVCANSGRIVGLEALARWTLPDGRMISPAEFIPVAEETGLIFELGAWVLHQACRKVREWQSEFPQWSELYVSVNLSGKQLMQAGLFDLVESIVKGTDYRQQNLRLEITESSLLEDSESNAILLQQFRDNGYQFYIDDFGTGFSSLSYLHRLPLDALKIDYSFVSKLLQGDEHQSMIETIISIAHNFKMRVVAEGIENEAQLLKLRELGCDYLQGYYLSPPLSADALRELIATKTSL